MAKRGADEVGVEGEAGERTQSKIETQPGNLSGRPVREHLWADGIHNNAAGEEEPLETKSENIDMSGASGLKRTSGDIKELDATSKVQAVRERWADLEDSDEDKYLVWEKQILGEKDGEKL